MSRLVIVKFEGNPKEYAFLTHLNSLKTGDRVMDKRYDKPFVVKSVDFNFNNSVTYRGHVLKWLTEETVLWIATEYSKPKENMEKRNISISLEQAREWYHNDCGLLRRLALSAFTEEELTEPQTFEEVCRRLGIEELNFHWEALQEKVLKTMERTSVSLKLGLIATYFNKNWQPETIGRKYFIAQGISDCPSSMKLENGFYIFCHETVMYPGIIYFKDKESVVKAFNMLKDELTALYR